MIVEQIYLECLSQASYLIGDETTGQAAVVDPRRDVDEYLDRAKALGLTIRHCVLTHFHADFASGHLELRDRCGATIYLGAGARADYPFTPLHDGDTIDLGRIRLQCLATPGHTPESISVLVFDLATSDTVPHAVLTGDTLFVGDVGRPDLLGSVGRTAEEMAALMYDSLRDKLMKLPPQTRLLPGHGAGSMCGKSLGPETSSTIGAELARNAALQPMDRRAFVAMLTADQPAAPAYFGHDAAYNKQEHPTLDATLQQGARPLGSDAFLRLRAAGAQVLDVRPGAEYAAAHLRGSIAIGLGGRFATFCGTVLDAARPILLIAAPGDEKQAIVRLGRIGFDRVAGFLDGGIAAVAGDRDVVSTARIPPRELAQHLAGHPGEVLLDVRNPGEWQGGVIDGAVTIALGELRERRAEIPAGRPVTIYCGSGYRSLIAKGLLEEAGRTALTDVVGGYAAWRAQRASR